MRLLHNDFPDYLSGGNQYLSFGERNAFAIVLFMYECLSKAPELIILDDPISSFDKNKKYAILQMLFRRDAKESLKSKTVLMLTHDVEPIIDTVKSLHDKFNNMSTATFLKISSGIIKEHEVLRSDILTFSQIYNKIKETDTDLIIKLIYLRRNYEIIDDKNNAYQVLSNLFHKRNEEDATDSRVGGGNHKLVKSLFDNGCEEIAKEIVGFNYVQVLSNLNNKDCLFRLYSNSLVGYEKLQLFRIIMNEDWGNISDTTLNPVIKKFINETYHIENEFICQLSPAKFDLIPEYVVKECDSIIATYASTKIN